MPRMMSFSMTKDAVREGTKTVTRRTGWHFLKPGDVLWAVEQAMGLPKGGHVVKIRLIRVTSKFLESLTDLLTEYSPEGIQEEMAREGFPGMTAQEFIDMFCEANGWHPEWAVNRIEFEYVNPDEVFGGTGRRR